MGCGRIIDGVPVCCLAYDSVIGANNVAEIAQPRFADTPESLVDESGLLIGDHWFPDPNGFSMLGFNSILSFTGKLFSADGVTIVTFSIEGTNDEALTDWQPCTEIFYRNDMTTGHVNATITNGTLYYGFAVYPSEPFPYQWCRTKIVIAGSINNSATTKMLRKAK